MGLPVFEPKGAFYIFPDIRAAGTDVGGILRKTGPGKKKSPSSSTASTATRAKSFVHISYAASMDTIQEALKRMARFVAQYRKD